MNSFKEWISDNLRYILLGVVCLILLVIGFFAVRLITGTEKKVSAPDKKVESTVDGNEASDEDSDGEGAAGSGVTVVSKNLVRNDPEVLDVVTKYYTARAGKDYTTLETLCEVFNDTTRSEIESQDAAIESYSNILTYSKQGMTPDSYVVYTYFDAKLPGISTLAPSLRELYLIKGTDGKLIISDKDSDAKLQAFIEQLRTDDDVQALIADVDQKLAEAEASDPNLKEFIESGSANAPTKDSEDGESAEGGNAGGSVGTKLANTGVNVRGEPSTDGAIYGSLYEGMEVEVLENLDNGWSHIRYDSNGTTIEGYVMTQYLS